MYAEARLGQEPISKLKAQWDTTIFLQIVMVSLVLLHDQLRLEDDTTELHLREN